MDPVKLRREYGKDMVLCGGIDKRAMARGKKAIDEELDRHMRPMLESGGFIPTVDHTVPPDVSYDNFTYYIARKRAIAEGG